MAKAEGLTMCRHKYYKQRSTEANDQLPTDWKNEEEKECPKKKDPYRHTKSQPVRQFLQDTTSDPTHVPHEASASTAMSLSRADDRQGEPLTLVQFHRAHVPQTLEASVEAEVWTTTTMVRLTRT